MKTFLKKLKYNIDLDTVEDIINNDKDLGEILLEKTKKIFSNRCFDNSYILE